MGGGSWEEFVPYQPNIEKALRDCQQDVFARGEYYDLAYGEGALEFLNENEFFELSPAEQEKMLDDFGLDRLVEPLSRLGSDGLKAWLVGLAPAGVPASLDDFYVLRSLSYGTSSVLDMDGISATPQPNHVSPLTPSDLIRIFGTDRPTHELVEQNYTLAEDIGRGEGRYIIVYQDDEPDEICFTGWSGD